MRRDEQTSAVGDLTLGKLRHGDQRRVGVRVGRAATPEVGSGYILHKKENENTILSIKS